MRQVIFSLLGSSYTGSISSAFPILNIAAVAALAGTLVLRSRWSRVFAAYAALFYTVTILQQVGKSEHYGFGIVTNGFIMMLLVVAAWWLEFFAGRTQLDYRNAGLSRLWVVPLALVAFWYPVGSTGQPDFNPVRFLFGPSGAAFCLVTPLLLSVLILNYPRVNVVTLRVTALAGLTIGVYNLLANFGRDAAAYWWNGVLHLPLIIVPLFALVLAYQKGVCGSRREGIDVSK